MKELKVKYELKNEIENGITVLTISGAIGGPDFFTDELISAKDVRNALEGIEGDITIKLNSPGGSVFEGVEIYNYLKDLPNKVTVEITGVAASIASVIAMAADEVVMCLGSQMMIHRPATMVYGTIDDLMSACELLEKTGTSIVDIYAERTKKTEEEIKALLLKTTWMTADEAVSNGFADRKKDNRDEVIKELTDKVNALTNLLNKADKTEEPELTGIYKFIRR